MKNKFQCKNCRKIFEKNPRLKEEQNYCSQKICQQARKNKWEREKLLKDPDYKQKRKVQKQQWYKNKPGDLYQREYRERRSSYQEENVKKQRSRNQNKLNVKILEQLQTPGAGVGDTHLFYLVPYNKHLQKNIVKTDALIVSINCLPAP